jgi:hypothetical protein
MCGKGKGNNPFGSTTEWLEWHKKWAADPLGLGLTDFSGNFGAKVLGTNNLEERYAEEDEKAAKRRARLVDRADYAQLQDSLATPSASSVNPARPRNPAADIANRRRQALLSARVPLTPQSGLGANAPLY